MIQANTPEPDMSQGCWSLRYVPEQEFKLHFSAVQLKLPL